MQTQPSPSSWMTTLITSLQWPVIVVASYALGRYVNKLEVRVFQAEKNVKDLIERHMPAVHHALQEVQSTLEVIKAYVMAGTR